MNEYEKKFTIEFVESLQRFSVVDITCPNSYNKHLFWSNEESICKDYLNKILYDKSDKFCTLRVMGYRYQYIYEEDNCFKRKRNANNYSSVFYQTFTSKPSLNIGYQFSIFDYQ